MSPTMTFAPSATYISTTPRAIPETPPVTTATFPDKRPMMSFPRQDGGQCLHALPVPDDGWRLAGRALRLVFAHHIEHHPVRAGVSKFLDPFANVCSASPGHDGVDQPIAAALAPVRGLEAGLGERGLIVGKRQVHGEKGAGDRTGHGRVGAHHAKDLRC